MFHENSIMTGSIAISLSIKIIIVYAVCSFIKNFKQMPPTLFCTGFLLQLNWRRSFRHMASLVKPFFLSAYFSLDFPLTFPENSYIQDMCICSLYIPFDLM